jgi:predicted metalloprotease with PDZ domain
VIGALLDLSIRHDTAGASSLDDVMRALYQDFYLKNKGYTNEDLIAIISRITKRDYRDFFRRYVQGVEVPAYDTILGYAGYKLENVEVPAPTMGFRMATSNDGPTVSFITPDSPADEGGLVVGDVVLTIDDMNIQRAGHGLPGLREWLTPKIGQTVDVVVQRNGAQKTLKIKVGSRPDRTLKINPVSQLTAEQQKIRDGWAPGGKEAAASR